MKRLVVSVVATLGACALALSAGPASAVVTAGSPGSASLTRSAAAPVGLTAPWSREEVHPGVADLNPYHIQHVRELQYRLKWVGLYPLTPTGTYYGVTVRAVKAFQARWHLPVTGVATAATWKRLLQRTVRHPLATPGVCKTAGWHVCYDRSMHQVVLWVNGAMDNTWLVRGGGVTTQTRLGTHRVYYRDINHVSSIFGTPMPYSQFFDGGEAVHGSRLMMNPFVDHSHGCINMYVEDARQLWNLTYDKTLWVTVYGSWA